MSGRKRLHSALSQYDEQKEDATIFFPGVLGAFVRGIPVVPVANKPGVVYVRMRDNNDEIIEAVNGVVSNIYDLPVLVVRDEVNISNYRIYSRDIARYSSWDSNYSPEHSTSHTFGSGGDVTWVSGQQFLPLLAYPSGSAFADAFVIDRYVYYWNQWRQVGGIAITGSTQFNPTGAFNARMVLLYLHPSDGTFRFATGSLSEFNAVFVGTGTSAVLPYLPAPPEANDIPIAGVRLVTGTTVISWANLYDVRPFYTPLLTGTAGGGGTTIITGTFGSGYPTGTFTQGSVPFGDALGSLAQNNIQFFWDNSSGTLLLGDRNPANASSTARLIVSPLGGSGTSAGLMAFAYGSGNFNYINTFHARGTKAAKTATQSGDTLFRIQSRGYGATAYASAARASIYTAANENWTDSNNGTQIEFYATETGTTTINRIAHVKGDSLFVEKGLKVNMDILSFEDSEFSMTPKTAIIQRVCTGAISTGTYNITLPSLEEAKNNLIIIYRGERDEGDEVTVPIILNGFQGELFADDDQSFRTMAVGETLYIYSDGFKWYDLTRGASKVRSTERFYRTGILTVDTGAFHLFNIKNRRLHLLRANAVVDSAPNGDDIIIDILLDGNSVFADMASMLHITDGDVTGDTVVFQNDIWESNQEMRVDVVQVGSILPGNDLVVTIVYE